MSTTTGMSLVDSLLASGWEIPWKTFGPDDGHVLVANMPTKLAILVELPPGQWEWLAEYLKDWLADLSRNPLESEASFVYLVAARTDSGLVGSAGVSWHVVERGWGSSPRAPADWPLRPLPTLIRGALTLLNGQ